MRQSMLIIGGGLTGLSAGIYARKSGYDTTILEQNETIGGTFSSFKAEGLIFNRGMDHIIGLQENHSYHAVWQELDIIGQLSFYQPDVYNGYQSENGRSLYLYADQPLMLSQIQSIAPEDTATGKAFLDLAEQFGELSPDINNSHDTNWFRSFFGLNRSDKHLKKLWNRYLSKPMSEFVQLFKNPFLKQGFSEMEGESISAAYFLRNYGWFLKGNYGYIQGGVSELTDHLKKQYTDLGGRIFTGSKTAGLLIENNKTIGVRLQDGSREFGHIVVSTVDGLSTLFQWIENKHRPKKVTKFYEQLPASSSMTVVSLNVPATFILPSPLMTYRLKESLNLDGQLVDRIYLRYYPREMKMNNAQQKRVGIQVMIPANYEFWEGISANDHKTASEIEKLQHRVIEFMDDLFRLSSDDIIFADTRTPHMHYLFQGNWHGIYSGWLPTPEVLTTELTTSFPKLRNFYHGGRWATPEGSLSQCVLSGRDLIRSICMEDERKFIAK